MICPICGHQLNKAAGYEDVDDDSVDYECPVCNFHDRRLKYE